MTSDLSSPSGKRSHDDSESADMEDMGQRKRPAQQTMARPTVTKHLTTPSQQLLSQKGGWRSVLGPPPERGTTRVGVAL